MAAFRQLLSNTLPIEATIIKDSHCPWINCCSSLHALYTKQSNTFTLKKKLRSSLRIFVGPMQRGSQFCTLHCVFSRCTLLLKFQRPSRGSSVLPPPNSSCPSKQRNVSSKEVDRASQIQHKLQCQQSKAGHKCKDLSTK